MTAEDIKFGTDGWRGIIAWDFTFNNVRRMAQALANWINVSVPSDLGNKTGLVVIGYDRRFLSDRFAADVASILKLNKIDATLLDKPVSTPVISCLTYTKFWLGVMITASHNPPHYNGIKIKTEGGALPARLGEEIEQALDKKTVLYVPSNCVETKKGMERAYFKYVASKVNIKKAVGALKGKIAVDYMRGSAAGYTEELLPKQKIIALNESRDPVFGDVSPEPKEKNLTLLKKTVLENKCAAGFAYDGDGDRLAVIDDAGLYLSPCIVSALTLDYLIKHKKLKGKVLQCLSMGYLNKRIARAHGLPFEEVPVGFKHIAERIPLEDIAFGAEESG
ncbi:MAG: phosphoglucomutase/phosphomannomutase family protein, partial [Elusimicrobiota bacterium]|nr:phosphoglucomutase/phosphomannomutase family protein [Elusimicrobiota bacterium]